MKLSPYVEETLIAAGLPSGTKSELLEKLLTLAEEHYPLGDKAKILGDLVNREKQSTTGIGCSIAVPHTIVEGLPKTLLVIGSVPNGTEFHAVDSKPVKVVFLLLSPPNKTREHIKLLARIARICSIESLVEDLASAPTAGDVLNRIAREDESHVG